ncbi:Short transmembrane mitochondrial protein 1 [Dillenia turbinata]|uniref:Short transmembrane mitochondrial protein 1 n=1 Tax=Dillenia turbinata TaxID=194707 RepID=A0AAN8UTF6_9MAGN
MGIIRSAFSFMLGTVCGVYIAQNYKVPDIKKMLDDLYKISQAWIHDQDCKYTATTTVLLNHFEIRRSIVMQTLVARTSWEPKMITPEDYIVGIIGAGPNASDISRLIFPVANVHLASRVRNVAFAKLENHDNARQHATNLAENSIVKQSRLLPSLIIELQSKWVAKVLSGKVVLPTKEEMAASVEKLYRYVDETGWPKRFTHKLQ